MKLSNIMIVLTGERGRGPWTGCSQLVGHVQERNCSAALDWQCGDPQRFRWEWL